MRGRPSQPTVRNDSAWLIGAAGLAVPMMRERAEMLYQNDRDYVFDSTKFERRFGFAPTPYADGIRECVRILREEPAGRGRAPR